MINLYVPQIAGFSLRNKPGAVITAILIIAMGIGLYFKMNREVRHGRNHAFLISVVARWYDLYIIYKSDIPQRNFSISLPRSASLEDLLDILRKQGGNFVRDGKTIVVLK